MSELQMKYDALDPTGQQSVLNFIDFLLNKKQISLDINKDDYRQRLLHVGVWHQEDVDFMKMNGK